MQTKWVIGIDEAGRGPLAGPVAVGAVMVPRNFDWALVAGAKDSKQMTPAQREDIYKRMRALRARGALDFAVSFSSAASIDHRGIVPAIRSALDRSLTKITKDGPLQKPQGRSLGNVEVLLDGGLRAPERFLHQKTIIRGDQSQPVISLASIAAKVERDRLMARLAKKYPAYSFEIHKGYGTLAHRRAIVRVGICDIHRTTFCTGLDALQSGSNAV